MFERFTDRSRRVIVLAQERCRMFRHPEIDTHHILLALIDEGEGVAAKAMEAEGMTVDKVMSSLLLHRGEGTVEPTGHVPFTKECKKALELGLREALQLGHNYIGTEHLLLALMRGENEPTAVTAILGDLAVAPAVLRQRVIHLLSGYSSPGKPATTEHPEKHPDQLAEAKHPVIANIQHDDAVAALLWLERYATEHGPLAENHPVEILRTTLRDLGI